MSACHAFHSVSDIVTAEFRLNLVPVLKALPHRVFSDFCDSSFVLCTKIQSYFSFDWKPNPWRHMVIDVATQIIWQLMRSAFKDGAVSTVEAALQDISTSLRFLSL